MQIKKVLIFCISLNKGGAERVVSLLLKEYAKDETLEVHFMMMESGIAYDLPDSIRPIILSHKKKSGLVKLLELPFVAWRVATYVKEHKIESVLSFLYRPNYINILAKFFLTKHRALINIRSTTSRYKKEGLLGRVNLFLIRTLFPKADMIISNSQGVAEDLESLVNVECETKVIYNPVDMAYIEQQKNLQPEESPFVFHKEKKYIISVGRLIPLKRNRDLIDAFFELHKKHKELELIFLGDGPLLEELQEYTQRLSIEKRVHFLGNVSNPFYYLARSDLFVLNSETEGFPNVLVEAMAVGIPVISSDCKSGPREILENGKYGELYRVGDVKSLCEKIEHTLYEATEIEQRVASAYQRMDNFHIEKVMKEYRKIV